MNADDIGRRAVRNAKRLCVLVVAFALLGRLIGGPDGAAYGAAFAFFVAGMIGG